MESDITEIPLTIIIYPTNKSEQYKTIKTRIKINDLQNLEGNYSLLLSLSQITDMNITSEDYIIKVNDGDYYTTIVDIKQFIFYYIKNLQNETLTDIILKPKIIANKNKYEDMEIINQNMIKRKPIKPSDKIKCSICSCTSTDAYHTFKLGPMYGPYRYKGNKYYVHLLCAVWLPNVTCTDDGSDFTKVGSEIYRSKSLHCSICKKSKPNIKCCFKGCEKVYHYYCTLSVKDSFEYDRKQYELLCPEHRHYTQRFEQLRIEKEEMFNYENNSNNDYNVCYICKCSTEQNSIVLCNKCNKNYFHLQCGGYNYNSYSQIKNGVIDDDANFEEDYFCKECQNMN